MYTILINHFILSKTSPSSLQQATPLSTTSYSSLYNKPIVSLQHVPPLSTTSHVSLYNTPRLSLQQATPLSTASHASPYTNCIFQCWLGEPLYSHEQMFTPSLSWAPSTSRHSWGETRLMIRLPCQVHCWRSTLLKGCIVKRPPFDGDSRA